jgi:pimeloyl-ACP methyl ester carboxylesterase
MGLLKRALSILILCSSIALAAGAVTRADDGAQAIDGMYVHTYGNPSAQPLVYIHGGPGFDSWSFEETTAQQMAAKGYYVVVYDRRGEGRSKYTGQSDYTFKTAVKDLKLVCDTLKLKSPVILSHSFGGPIAVRFEQAYPGYAKKIVLVSGAIDSWGWAHSTYDNCVVKYTKTSPDPVKFAKMKQIFDQYFQYEHACQKDTSKPALPESPCPPTASSGQPLQGVARDCVTSIIDTLCPIPPLDIVQKEGDYEGDCGVYQGYPGPGAKEAYDSLNSHPLQGEKPHGDALAGYYQDPDSFVRNDGTPYAAAHRDRFCGVYGDHDGLFDGINPDGTSQLQKFQAAFKTTVVPSGHNIFLDQNQNFTAIVKSACGI